MWHDCQCENSPQETKWQKLTTIGQRMAFNNEQYLILSMKGHEDFHDTCNFSTKKTTYTL